MLNPPNGDGEEGIHFLHMYTRWRWCVKACVHVWAAVQEAQMLCSAVGLVNICVSCDSGGPPRVRPSVSLPRLTPQTSFSCADSGVSASLLLWARSVCLLVTAGSSVSMKQSHHSDNSVSGSLWSAGCSDIEQLCSLIIIVVCAFVLHRYQHSETWIHSFPVARKQYCMFGFHVEGMRCHSVRWLLFSEDISLMWAGCSWCNKRPRCSRRQNQVF